MSQDEKLVVSVVAMRAEGYSADGDGIVISLRTKFSSAERKYLIPLECFHDLIVDLQRLNANANPTVETPSREDINVAAE
jgi:hypothetical protein